MLTLQSDNLLDLLCAHLVMGGSPIDFCATQKIRYDHLCYWLAEDPRRQQRYNTAIDARAEWLVQRIIQELKRVAIADVREAFNSDGTAKKLDELSPELAACISSITVGEDGKQRVRFRGMNDKLKCLELLGKNFMMFLDRHEIPVGESHVHLTTINVKSSTDAELVHSLLGRGSV